MITNLKDLYTYTTNITPLIDPNTTKTVGTTVISYEIRTYRDTRNLSNTLAYQVLCTQRIIIPNSKSATYVVGAQDIKPATGFSDYPAMIQNSIAITNPNGGGAPVLVKYTPKTINASVNISNSSDSGTSASVSYQHTRGSSTSQSNTYGASVSLGFFGEDPTGGISADYSHTSGSEQSQSNSTGSDTGRNSQNSAGESMSVQDWACYSYIDTQDSTPTWVWGQEYPWDVIKFNNDDNGGSTNNINLPDFVKPLLGDATQALPPSQLSLFGVDFTMKCVWIMVPALEPVGPDTGTVTITHTMNYCTASHSGAFPSVTANINPPIKFTYTAPSTQPIDLFTYGLDPILSNNVAIVGFIPNKFIIPPSASSTTTAQPTQFKIISQSNNLLIQDTSDYSKVTSSDVGAGFSASETALTATFTQNCTQLVIKLSFKITDTVNNYTLFMKHWKISTSDVMLQISFNPDLNNPDQDIIITKYVDAQEAEGGENNLLSIALRNQSYGSVDYHDYLQLGLNTIYITITTPSYGTPYTEATPVYQIRAISIEKN